MNRLDTIRQRLREFTRDRDWEQFHDPKNLAMAIASEAGELVALLRWIEGARADDFVRSPEARERVSHEVADIAITLLLFCDRAGIDLLDAIEAKIAINAARYPIDQVRGRSERPLDSAH